ncbi:flagellar hook-length control protein FliK [Tabrizicola aquatica]|uniref:flagellar hook-length control protein FliK n=1 Tax=Tabrizicola aquatica TaxID=909926 RepID=UPI0015E19718|nr:flagellar hook-length control protein FliK [Tabrizicola aquatica]
MPALAPASPAARPPLPAWLELAELDHRAEPEFGIGLSGFASAGPATAAPTVSPTAAPVPQAVALQVMQGLARHQDGTTEITLSPEELGTVRLRLRPDSRDAERMVVMLSFDRPETMDLFRRHADQLAEAIRSAGYAGVDIGFDQGERSRGGFADAAGDPTGEAGDPSPSPPPMVQTPPPRLVANATLDLRL